MNTILVIMNEHGAPEVISDSAEPVNVILMETSLLSTSDVNLDDMEYMANSAVSRCDTDLVNKVIAQRANQITENPMAGFHRQDTLTGVYTSRWEEGDVETRCTLNLPSLALTVETSEEGVDFQQHNYDTAAFTINGHEYPFMAEDGELTLESKEMLCTILMDTPSFMIWHTQLMQTLQQLQS